MLQTTHPLCVALNATLHPVRLHMTVPSNRVGANLTVGGCLLVESRTPEDYVTGLILKPAFTVAHRLFEVIVGQTYPGGIRDWQGGPDLEGLKLTGRELLSLVQRHVDAFIAARGTPEGNPIFEHPMINQTTGLLLPGFSLDT